MSSKGRAQKNLRFQLLSEVQISKIYDTSLKILEQVGTEVYEEKLLKLLKDGGAKVKGTRANIPPALVEESLDITPKKIPIYSREGELSMQLEGYNSYFGNGSDCPNVRDPYTGVRRRATKKDIERLTVVCDALANIDFVMPGAIPSDVPSSISDLHQFQATLLNTTKPIVFTSLNRAGTESIIEMARAAVGGKKELQDKPFIVPYIEPSSPLRVSRDAAEKLLLCAEERLPILFAPGPMSGASAPITLAGTIALLIAENLIGVVLSQLVREGAPVIIGGCASEMDMRTTVSPYAGPTFNLLNAGISEMCHFLGLPMFGTAGCSDSKLPDEQAAMESALSCFIQPLSGGNLIHDVGYIESGMTASFEMLVINNELIGCVKRILEGIDTDPGHLALEVVEKVGPGGNFLTERHTLDYFKKEHWRPELSNRENFQGWQTRGGLSLRDSAKEKVHTILEDHKPRPLREEIRQKIADVIEKRSK
jgi:trimethylamine--corrinoid protein Co-methyltransferase